MAISGEDFCFLENFTHTIDSQRRFAIPADWRQKDGDTQFVLLPAKNRVIQAIPMKTFQDEILVKARKMVEKFNLNYIGRPTLILIQEKVQK